MLNNVLTLLRVLLWTWLLAFSVVAFGYIFVHTVM
jgi:hypothetical protein